MLRGPRICPLVQVVSCVGIEPVVGERRRPLLEGDLHLEPGEVRTETPVDPEAERHVPVDLAVDEELVGALEHLGVVVRCGERDQHLVAGVHRAPRHRGVADDATAHRDRRVVAQHLFGERQPDRVVERLAAESFEVVRVRCEMPQPRPDRRPRRVDPGEDQQQQVAVLQLPVDRLAVDLGLDHQRRRDRRAARPRAPRSASGSRRACRR